MAAGLCSWGRRRLVPRPWRDRDARKGCGAPPRVPPARLPPEEEPLRDAHRGDPGHALPAPAVPSPADAPEGPLAGPGAASPQDRVPTPTREPRGLRAVREVTPKVPGQHLGLPRPAQGHPSPHGCRPRPDPVTRPPALGPGARDTGGCSWALRTFLGAPVARVLSECLRVTLSPEPHGSVASGEPSAHGPAGV